MADILGATISLTCDADGVWTLGDGKGAVKGTVTVDLGAGVVTVSVPSEDGVTTICLPRDLVEGARTRARKKSEVAEKEE